MKYQLETIPIWDAYEQDSECPLCLLEEKTERNYLNFFLGNSVMNPEMRVKVNQTGFCPLHYKKLFKTRENRHGLGLMTHTHLQKQEELLEKKQKPLLRKIRSITGMGKLRVLFRKKAPLSEEATAFAEYLRSVVDGCMICNRITNTMKRYAFTIVYLWNKDEDFHQRYKTSHGFCLEHLALLIELAVETLPQRKLAEWLEQTLQQQNSALHRLEEEVYTFTQNYAYGSSVSSQQMGKKTLHRTIQKLIGHDLTDMM